MFPPLWIACSPQENRTCVFSEAVEAYSERFRELLRLSRAGGGGTLPAFIAEAWARHFPPNNLDRKTRVHWIIAGKMTVGAASFLLVAACIVDMFEKTHREVFGDVIL